MPIILKPEQPKTIELTHAEAINLFNDLENNCLQVSEKKIIRSAVNFHLYLEEQLKNPGLRLKDIRALFGIRFDTPNSNDSGEGSDASSDESNSDDKNAEDVGSDENLTLNQRLRMSQNPRALARQAVVLVPKIILA